MADNAADLESRKQSQTPTQTGGKTMRNMSQSGFDDNQSLT